MILTLGTSSSSSGDTCSTASSSSSSSQSVSENNSNNARKQQQQRQSQNQRDNNNNNEQRSSSSSKQKYRFRSSGSGSGSGSGSSSSCGVPSGTRHTVPQNSKNHNHNHNNNKGNKKGKSKKLTLKNIDTKTIGPYVALDCEMVGVGPGGIESAIARVSLIKWSKEEVLLDTFVKLPAGTKVTDYRTFVSGVTARDLESPDALGFEECRDLVLKILEGRVLVGHALDNDLQALCIDHPDCDKRDTATYIPFMQLGTTLLTAPMSSHSTSPSKNSQSNSPSPTRRSPHLVMCPRKLKDLAFEKLDGLEIQHSGKAHSSIEDARAALKLYRKVRDEWEILMCWQKKKAACPGMITDYNSIPVQAAGGQVTGHVTGHVAGHVTGQVQTVTGTARGKSQSSQSQSHAQRGMAFQHNQNHDTRNRMNQGQVQQCQSQRQGQGHYEDYKYAHAPAQSHGHTQQSRHYQYHHLDHTQGQARPVHLSNVNNANVSSPRWRPVSNRTRVDVLPSPAHPHAHHPPRPNTHFA